MAGYLCKDPDCTDTVAWHLKYGDWDCIEDNRDAVIEFVEAAEQNMPAPELRMSLYVTCPGYEPQSATVILTKLPTEEEQLELAQGPPVEVPVQVPPAPTHQM